MDAVTGAITVAECPDEQHGDMYGRRRRRKREIITGGDFNKKVNLTLVGQTGVIDQQLMETEPEEFQDYHNLGVEDHQNDELAYKVISGSDVSGTSVELQAMGGNGAEDNESSGVRKVPGRAPCLDFETQPVYFLMYKVILHIPFLQFIYIVYFTDA